MVAVVAVAAAAATCLDVIRCRDYRIDVASISRVRVSSAGLRTRWAPRSLLLQRALCLQHGLQAVRCTAVMLLACTV